MAHLHALLRNAPQIAFQAAHWILLVVREVDATLEQHAAHADGFGILSDQRALLRDHQQQAKKLLELQETLRAA